MSKRGRRILAIVTFFVIYAVGGLILAFGTDGVAEGRLLGAVFAGILLLAAAIIMVLASGLKYYFKHRQLKGVTVGSSLKRSVYRIFN